MLCPDIFAGLTLILALTWLTASTSVMTIDVLHFFDRTSPPIGLIICDEGRRPFVVWEASSHAQALIPTFDLKDIA